MGKYLLPGAKKRYAFGGNVATDATDEMAMEGEGSGFNVGSIAQTALGMLPAPEGTNGLGFTKMGANAFAAGPVAGVAGTILGFGADLLAGGAQRTAADRATTAASKSSFASMSGVNNPKVQQGLMQESMNQGASFAAGGPTGPYRAKNKADYDHRVQMYNDSLSLHNDALEMRGLLKQNRVKEASVIDERIYEAETRLKNANGKFPDYAPVPDNEDVPFSGNLAFYPPKQKILPPDTALVPTAPPPPPPVPRVSLDRMDPRLPEVGAQRTPVGVPEVSLGTPGYKFQGGFNDPRVAAMGTIRSTANRQVADPELSGVVPQRKHRNMMTAPGVPAGLAEGGQAPAGHVVPAENAQQAINDAAAAGINLNRPAQQGEAHGGVIPGNGHPKADDKVFKPAGSKPIRISSGEVYMNDSILRRVALSKGMTPQQYGLQLYPNTEHGPAYAEGGPVKDGFDLTTYERKLRQYREAEKKRGNNPASMEYQTAARLRKELVEMTGMKLEDYQGKDIPDPRTANMIVAGKRAEAAEAAANAPIPAGKPLTGVPLRTEFMGATTKPAAATPKASGTTPARPATKAATKPAAAPTNVFTPPLGVGSQIGVGADLNTPRQNTGFNFMDAVAETKSSSGIPQVNSSGTTGITPPMEMSLPPIENNDSAGTGFFPKLYAQSGELAADVQGQVNKAQQETEQPDGTDPDIADLQKMNKIGAGINLGLGTGALLYNAFSKRTPTPRPTPINSQKVDLGEGDFKNMMDNERTIMTNTFLHSTRDKQGLSRELGALANDRRARMEIGGKMQEISNQETMMNTQIENQDRLYNNQLTNNWNAREAEATNQFRAAKGEAITRDLAGISSSIGSYMNNEIGIGAMDQQNKFNDRWLAFSAGEDFTGEWNMRYVRSGDGRMLERGYGQNRVYEDEVPLGRPSTPPTTPTAAGDPTVTKPYEGMDLSFGLLGGEKNGRGNYPSIFGRSRVKSAFSLKY